LDAQNNRNKGIQLPVTVERSEMPNFQLYYWRSPLLWQSSHMQ